MKENHRKFLPFVGVFALCALALLSLCVKRSASAFANSRDEQKNSYTFLICGVDKSASNTDVMMIASLNSEAGSLDVLQIPRDTFVNPKSSGLGITRVNAVYASFLRKSALSGVSAKKEAMERLSSMLSEALCVDIDRYVLIDTAVFARIIDAVGGIEYDVPFAMHYDDPVQNLHIHLEKGKQILDGKKAEGFMRYRSGYATGDLGRVEARGGFLREAFLQVRGKISAGIAAKIAMGLSGEVITNADVFEVAYIAEMLYSVDLESVNIKTLSGSAVQNPKTLAWTYYALNKRAALADINKYFGKEGSEISYESFDKKAVFTDDPYGENPYISKYYYSQIKIE